ncbi:MAG: M15 family metallopeptidase [Pseudomonadales bacterium]|jgi:D-alanyl-D-alanine dipeptidase|nr:M15 family metallopeptidase [Pseudomonadales bacterium]
MPRFLHDEAKAMLFSPAPPPGIQRAALPPGFVYAQEWVPALCVDLVYCGSHNFIGAPIAGYAAERLILTREAALALGEIQAELESCGLALKVFDGYRPQRAVDHFIAWAQDPDDLRMRDKYYPRLDKARLFAEGYLVTRSSHSRGSTVDVSLVDDNGAELDMGTCFDFFDPRSWPQSRAVGAPQRAHRLLLRSVMQRHGFVGVAEEWWHFTLREEPFPATYFDFVIA